MALGWDCRLIINGLIGGHYMRLHTNQAPFQTMAYFSHQLPFSAGNEMLGKMESPIFVATPRTLMYTTVRVHAESPHSNLMK